MIGVKLHGRLGNQMFQYAFAFASAKKLRTGFYLDEGSDHLLLHKVFNTRIPFTNRLSLLLQKIHVQQTGLEQILNMFFAYRKSLLKKEIVYQSNMPPSINLEKLYDNSFYSGYFQSVQYFKPFQKNIKEQFILKPSVSKSFYKKYGSKKYIAVHVRRTDYLNTSLTDFEGDSNIALPIAYYKKCLSLIDNSDDYEIFIVSDDVEYVKKEWPEVTARCESNDAAMDFAILMYADILIISNSSFSWWGAFLNRNCKKVYAPKNWVGYSTGTEFPKAIEEELPWEWIA